MNCQSNSRLWRASCFHGPLAALEHHTRSMRSVVGIDDPCNCVFVHPNWCGFAVHVPTRLPAQVRPQLQRAWCPEVFGHWGGDHFTTSPGVDISPAKGWRCCSQQFPGKIGQKHWEGILGSAAMSFFFPGRRHGKFVVCHRRAWWVCTPASEYSKFHSRSMGFTWNACKELKFPPSSGKAELPPNRGPTGEEKTSNKHCQLKSCAPKLVHVQSRKCEISIVSNFVPTFAFSLQRLTHQVLTLRRPRFRRLATGWAQFGEPRNMERDGSASAASAVLVVSINPVFVVV